MIGTVNRKSNRQARGKGSQAERLLLQELTDLGYDARRTHLSLFPDIIAWNKTDLLLIEVKARTPRPGAVSGALLLFRKGVQMMTILPNRCRILCYLRMNKSWSVYEWKNGVTEQVEPVTNKET